MGNFEFVPELPGAMMFAGNTVAEVTFGNGAAFGDDSVC